MGPVLVEKVERVAGNDKCVEDNQGNVVFGHLFRFVKVMLVHLGFGSLRAAAGLGKKIQKKKIIDYRMCQEQKL